MTRDPDHRERAAYAIVARALGVEVEHRDDGTRVGEVDVHIVPPDGRRAALEVTVVGDRDSLEVEALVTRHDWTAPGLRWRWDVRPGSKTRYERFEHHLTVLLAPIIHRAAGEGR